MAAVLELGKHTILGWILMVLVIGGFYVLRKKVLVNVKGTARVWSWIGFFAALAMVLLLSFPPVKPVPAVSGKSAGVTDVIHLSQGELTGVLTEDGAVEVYAGIPYAKPPVGELRWREPEPADPWEGVLHADHFAPMFMQPRNIPLYYSLAQIIGYHDYSISLSDNYREPVSEDALYLNIWKPAGEVSGLPVLVYVHGGSLQTGQPWYADYSGEGLAREGVIVVNFAYRLGIFGFFADEELEQESPHGTTGNYGLLDQILALQWVQDNIAAFGGDPGNVTLAGESAGSACVSALCTSKLARGLFRRVIGESSTVTAPKPAHSFRLLEEAFVTGKETKTRYAAATIEDLRKIPAEKLAAEMEYHHHLTVDGYALTETPYESYQKGAFNEEAQLQGFNAKEASLFLLLGSATTENYEGRVRAVFPAPYDEKVLELYPVLLNVDAKENWEEIFSTLFFSYGHYCWGRQANACGIPVYMYYFTKENKRLGPNHSGEEVYFYGNIPESSPLYDKTDRKLSESMVQYFVNFMKSGNPNGEGLPEWPQFDGSAEALELGTEIRMTETPGKELYTILDEMYGFHE